MIPKTMGKLSKAKPMKAVKQQEESTLSVGLKPIIKEKH